MAWLAHSSAAIRQRHSTASRQELFFTMPIINKKLLATLAAVLIMAGAALFMASRSAQQHPFLLIDADEGLTLTILQRSATSAAACDGMVSNFANGISSSCPKCRIRSSACINSLDEAQGRYLSPEPIDAPSVAIANGVIVFQSADRKLAMTACEGTARAAASTKDPRQRLTCFAPGTARPGVSQIDSLRADQAGFFYLTLVLCAIAVGLVLFIFANFFSAESPLDSPTLYPVTKPIFKMSNLVKRLLDIVAATLILTLMLPLLIVVTILILILEGRPAFYVSRRFIAADRAVSIVKFRTMVVDATSEKYRLKERFMRDGFLDIPLSCEVYTPIGRVLERTQLVELLQLFNVIFSGMSLIGSRPLPRDNIEILKNTKGWECRFDSPAGLTGLSQVVGKLNQTPGQRLELECLYTSVYKNQSGNILICDMLIAYHTIRLLLLGKSLSHEGAKKLIRAAYRYETGKP